MQEFAAARMTASRKREILGIGGMCGGVTNIIWLYFYVLPILLLILALNCARGCLTVGLFKVMHAHKNELLHFSYFKKDFFFFVVVSVFIFSIEYELYSAEVLSTMYSDLCFGFYMTFCVIKLPFAITF
ncbi:hypothetical protein HPP92_009309 [Vanilla planifolia]|uniref:Uncharacterized protein n=1 Tax=Vanilla planifolia TaxID=51239 RepID=A0A835RE21_VANPL|nr:hypothetical protein HPP92_009309 [Vanilla planifolia]